VTTYGTNNDDVLNMWKGNDVVYGLGGDDDISGGLGNDILVGGPGADDLHGGAHIDTASYTDSPSGVAVNLLSGTGIGGTAHGDTLAFIENLWGSYHNDILTGDGNANELWGLTGSDHLKGGGGADAMIGGLGNDTYYVDNWSDVVTEYAGEGSDTVVTEATYLLPHGADIETLRTNNDNGTAPLGLFGNSSGNVIIGNNGPNVISGGAGDDEMIGRGGDDIYYVDDSYDQITESAGNGDDEVRTSVDWSMTPSADVETLRTTNDNGTDAIYLWGNDSNNRIVGNAGPNMILGRGGDDELTGLGGHDVFAFYGDLDADTNVDTIVDFNVAEDAFRLFIGSFLALGEDVSHGEFVIGAAAQDADDHLIYDSNTGALFYDSDGVGVAAAVQFAQLSAGLALNHQYFDMAPL
jgi:Ca2+-binding RTX toxin-like protein